MLIKSQSEFEALFTKQSVILTRPPNDPKKMPRLSSPCDFSKQGLLRMLEERLGEGGTLAHYRAAAREALAAWERYNSAQPQKLSAPVGLWAEAVNKNRAHVRIIEAEARELHRLLDIELAKEVEQAKAEHHAALGVTKYKNGVPAFVDGRPVLTDSEGNLVFQDDGSSVAAYLDAVKSKAQAKATARKQANLARHQALEKVRNRSSLELG
jgi:hypothetical protein